VFEQRRCQCRTAPENQVRAVRRLDAVNIRKDVRSKTLERATFQSVRPVGRNILSSRVQAVRQRTAPGPFGEKADQIS
jgi:hypothetical protein